jgi:hypothetical protein
MDAGAVKRLATELPETHAAQRRWIGKPGTG